MKCKLSLDIRKNSMIKNDVWCSVLIEYEYKTKLGFNRAGRIESIYNRSSMSITDLNEYIEDYGGIKPFMLNHIDNKIKTYTGKTTEDLIIKELMDNVVEVDISNEELKILKENS